MRPALIALLALAIYIGPKPGTSLQPHYHWEDNSIVIDNDGGGEVDTFVMWYNRVKAAHTHVILRGQCVSACTLILMLPKGQVCVEPTASLGFHQVSIEDAEGKRVALPEETQALIHRYYPFPVQQWLKGKVLDLKHIQYMYANEIVALGIFNACASNSAN